jgi:hypothetical protein
MTSSIEERLDQLQRQSEQRPAAVSRRAVLRAVAADVAGAARNGTVIDPQLDLRLQEMQQTAATCTEVQQLRARAEAAEAQLAAVLSSRPYRALRGPPKVYRVARRTAASMRQRVHSWFG